MKVGNINFGARLTQSTFDFLVEARKKGLNTKKMENLMKETHPDEFVKTYTYKDKLLGMEIVENPKMINMQGGKTILKNNDFEYYYDAYFGADPANDLTSEIENGNFQSYDINQKLVDDITKNLKELSKKENSSEENKIKKALISKFGLPVSEINEVCEKYSDPYNEPIYM